MRSIQSSTLLSGPVIQAAVIFGLFWLIYLTIVSVNQQKETLDELGKLDFRKHNPKPIKVAVFVTALGNYIDFSHKLVETGRRLFLKSDVDSSSQIDHIMFGQLAKVTWVIFTNRVSQAPQGDDVIVVDHERLGWPGDSMLRPELYLNYTKTMDTKENYDYVYSIDSDNYFVNKVGLEFLGDTVGVVHWFHYPDPVDEYPFEKTPERCAAVTDPKKGDVYYSGSVYGGTWSRMLEMWKWLSTCTREYLDQDEIPPVHDETVLNKYFYVHTPEVVLNPSYYSGEDHYGFWPGMQRLVFRQKDYDKARAAEPTETKN